MNKKRIDQILVEKKLVESRVKAQAMIMAGQIFIDKKQIIKSSEMFETSIEIEIKNLRPEWVSRGSLKLIHAINIFEIDIQKKICLDIGASTGGFSHVLLKKGAKKIFAVDVGTNQLHETLKKEKKIINIEKTNARYLNFEIINERIDLIVCDVSFISMKKVIKPCMKFLKNDGKILALIKPQFEANKNEIKRGVVVDLNVHKRICEEYKKWFERTCNLKFIGILESPITGPKGNKEFLIYTKF